MLGFLIPPRESLAAVFSAVGMALVVLLSAFADVALALLIAPSGILCPVLGSPVQER